MEWYFTGDRQDASGVSPSNPYPVVEELRTRGNVTRQLNVKVKASSAAQAQALGRGLGRDWLGYT